MKSDILWLYSYMYTAQKVGISSSYNIPVGNMVIWFKPASEEDGRPDKHNGRGICCVHLSWTSIKYTVASPKIIGSLSPSAIWPLLPPPLPPTSPLPPLPLSPVWLWSFLQYRFAPIGASGEGAQGIDPHCNRCI